MSAVQPGDKTQLLVYSRMVEENGISAGSAYFTDKHGKLYGYMEDVQFKKLRRGALERLVSMAASAASAKHPSNASVPPKRLAAVTPSKPVSTPKPTVNGTSNSFASQSFSKSSPTTESSKSTLLSGPASTSASSSTPVPRSTFVHLGGPTRSASSETPLWLFPDGTGMAAVAYKQVPDVGRPVYGFDSPFLGAKLAASWTGGMEEMAGRFVDMLKAEQPQGPYRVAGSCLR